MRLLTLLLLIPTLSFSQQLEGRTVIAHTAERAVPVMDDDLYETVETVDCNVALTFLEDQLIVKNITLNATEIFTIAFNYYNEAMQADLYDLGSNGVLIVAYNNDKIVICEEWIPEYERFAQVFRFSDFVFVR